MTCCGCSGGRLEDKHEVGDRCVEHGHPDGVAVELALELGEDLRAISGARVGQRSFCARVALSESATAAATATTSTAGAAGAAGTAGLLVLLVLLLAAAGCCWLLPAPPAVLLLALTLTQQHHALQLPLLGQTSATAVADPVEVGARLSMPERQRRKSFFLALGMSTIGCLG